MSRAKTKTIQEIVLPDSLKTAIGEQQSRVWRLRNLIECVRQAADSSEHLDDLGAAISGLQDYADETHLALDAGLIVERAQAIQEEEQRSLRDAARLAAETGGAADPVEDSPTRQ